MNYTKKEIREGRERMARWSAKLRKKINLADMDEHMEATSHIGQSVMSRVRKENLHAVIVRQRPGGWVTDILFKNLPVGVPNVIGTPEATPMKTRAEAEEAGAMLLKSVLRTVMENELAGRDMKAKDVRHYELFGRTFEIPGAAIDQMDQAIGEALRNTPDMVEIGRNSLRARLGEMMSGIGFDDAIWEAAPDMEKNRVLGCMATLVLAGDNRFPRRTDPEFALDFGRVYSRAEAEEAIRTSHPDMAPEDAQPSS